MAIKPFLTNKDFLGSRDPSVNVNKFSPLQIQIDQENQDANPLTMQNVDMGNIVTDSVFGLSGTNVNQLDAGAFKNINKAPSIINKAEEIEKVIDGDEKKEETKKNLTDLSAIDQAKLIAEGAYAGQTGSEPDWGVASLLYFSKMAENASKPGATALGSAASAFTAPAAYLMQKEKQKADQKNKKASLIATLIPTLQAAKLKTKAKELPYVDTEGNVTYYNATQFANLDSSVKGNLRPYKDKNAESTKVYENTSEVDIVIDGKTIPPKGKMRLSESALATISPDISGNLLAYKKEPSAGERDRKNLIEWGLDYKNLSPEKKVEYGILYQKALEGTPVTERVNGVDVTTYKGKIDLSILKGLAVPDGYDPNKVIKQKRTDFKPDQIKQSGYAIRLFQNDGIVNRLISQGYTPNLRDMFRQQESIQSRGGNILQDRDAQLYYTATSNFLSALLRNESGAAIGPGEYVRRLRELFPQVGDDAEVIQTKKSSREKEINTFIKGGGEAFEFINPDAIQFLSTDVDGKKYNKLNSRGYVEYLEEQVRLTDGVIFKNKIKNKTIDELKAMIGSDDARKLLPNYKLEVIDQLLDEKTGEIDPNE